MGIDFVVDLPCVPKEALGVEQLVGLTKQRNQADAILVMVRQHGDKRPPSEIHLESAVMRPTGVEKRQVSLQQLFDAAGPLDAHRSACVGCPADLGAQGFGCVGYIAYPITPQAEAWLLGRLPDDLDSTAGAFLRTAIADFAWDGSYTANMRSQGETFFQAREPCARQWPELTLTSDQAFHMIFGVGHIQPSHATMLCLFLGLIPHDVPLDDLREAFGKPERLAALVGEVHLESDEPSVAVLMGFIEALVASATLGRALLLDG